MTDPSVPSDRACKSCGAPLIFARSTRGKLVPLDAAPLKRFVFDVEADGRAVVRLVETYGSHFATCPHAAEHRKASPA